MGYKTLLVIMGGVLLVTCSCQHKTGLKKYIQAVDDTANGLTQTRSLGQYFITAQYKPYPYILLKERHVEPQSEEWVQQQSNIAGLEYFSFSVGSNRGQLLSSLNAVSDSMNTSTSDYLAFKLEEDVYLIHGEDTLLPVLFHWPRSYELAQQETFMLGFPRGDTTQNITLVYDDRLLGIGVQKFTIYRKNIEALSSI